MGIVLANALVAGLISGAGVVIAQMANGGAALPTKATWLVAGLTALMSAGKDWQSHIALPPGLARIAVVVVLALGLAGCAGNAAVIEALAKDNATVCVRVTTIYGTLTAARSNIANGDVVCDTLQIKSPGVVNVPLSINPVVPVQVTK